MGGTFRGFGLIFHPRGAIRVWEEAWVVPGSAQGHSKVLLQAQPSPALLGRDQGLLCPTTQNGVICGTQQSGQMSTQCHSSRTATGLLQRALFKTHFLIHNE